MMSIKLIIITIVVAVCIFEQSEARQFTRASLRNELLRQGFPRGQLNDWVCLVFAESSGRTDLINPTNSDGSKDFGLFQINSRYWCNDGPRPGKGCNVRCRDVMTDDITVASRCAKLIQQRQGFTAWVGWNRHCRH